VESVGRVFVAAPVPDQTRLELAHRLGDVRIPGRVVPAPNWHLTLRFLGAVDRVVYERLLYTLDDTDLGPVYRLRLQGLGAFPQARKAAVIWLGVVEGLARLEALAGIAEEAAVSAGLPAEERPFRPHLTLSRVRPEEDVTRLVEAGAGVGVGWHSESIVVYRSHPGRGGVRYEPLETFSLSR
jgi:2'-5' RNA ligase